VAPYEKLSGLEDLYLEDSWVLEIDAGPDHLHFTVDAVMAESHPAWRPRKSNEQYSCLPVEICFDSTTSLDFRASEWPLAVDATGATDYGHIDAFTWEGDRYQLEGDWGSAIVVGPKPTVRALPEA